MKYSERRLEAAISFSGSGDNTIISAPSAGKLAIDFLSVMPTAATGMILKHGSTAISGAYPLDAKQAITFENTIDDRLGVVGIFAAGEAFVINIDTGTQTSGFVRYRIIDEN